jgi:hypothetical protein
MKRMYEKYCKLCRIEYKCCVNMYMMKMCEKYADNVSMYMMRMYEKYCRLCELVYDENG